MAFLGQFFYTLILGRFAKMPPPPQSCQKIAKKCILSDESGGKKLKKVLKWPDLVDPSV